MKHLTIRWNPATQEWFCIKCGRISDHISEEDARVELDQHDCQVPSQGTSTPPGTKTGGIQHGAAALGAKLSRDKRLRPLRATVQYMKRTVRVLRGRDIWQQVQIESERMRLGNEPSWCVCPSNLSHSSVVYSFGIGEDISFDLELIRRFGVQVHAFDPTPRSIQWLRGQALPELFTVHDFGVADYDGTCRFFPPANPSYVSHSVIKRETPGPVLDAPVHRLSTIMKMLGHSAIHVLKMDIEGAEYAVLEDLLSSEIRFDQLLVEFHHRWVSVGIEKTQKAIGDLNRVGYWIFDVSPSGREYSFKGTAT